MGININPGGASWSYGGFSRFRERLAAEEGITLSEMRGFGGTTEWETVGGKHVTPLAPLLNHSDCDGYLHSWECEEVLPRLKRIITNWSGSQDAVVQYDIEQGRRLINGMTHAVEHGCAVVFS